MSLFSRLFGGGSAPEAEPVTYQGFTIRPEPMAEGNRFRLAARVEKEVDGTVKSHHLIRADVFDSRDGAEAAAITKAKQVIDEQGDRLLG